MWGRRCLPWLPVVAILGLGTMGCAREARPTRMLVDANPIRVEIEGQGTVRSQALALECTSLDRTCQAENFHDAWTDLVAEPAPGWQFAGWQERRAHGDRWAPCGPLYRATFVKLASSAERVIAKRER
jgi:hypothetical protein